MGLGCYTGIFLDQKYIKIKNFGKNWGGAHAGLNGSLDPLMINEHFGIV